MSESIGHDYSTNHFDFPEIAPFDPTKKKKKTRKNKVVYRHHIDGSLHSSVDGADMLLTSEQARDDYPDLMENIRVESTKLTISARDFEIDAAEGLHDHDMEDEEEVGIVPQSNYPFEGSEHDYPYRELLRRLLCSMRKDGTEPDGDRQRTVLRPPQVLSDGIGQTVFVNLTDLCKTMHRPPEHVKAYMLKEIGTDGSLDGEGRLVLKGRLTSINFDDLLQRYINEYVLCDCCRSPDTTLAKETQLLLQCEMCGEERSVPPVSAGYGTHVGRRKRQTFLQ